VAGDLVKGFAQGPSKCRVADVDQFETRSPEKLGELIEDVLPEIWVSNTDHLRRAFFYVRHPDFPFRAVNLIHPYYTSSPIVRFADFWWLAVTALGGRQECFMAGGPPSTTFVYTIPTEDAPRW
jgi:hypothetical protein